MSMTLPPGHPGKELFELLSRYKESHPKQSGSAEQIMAFLQSTEHCFERSHTEGHITGSAWILNPAQDKVLLTLHRKLKRWMQPGGHADGDSNALNVAIREAEEESGISGITPLCTEIFDIDVHLIPARPDGEEPAHLHYDIRFLLQAPHEDFCISDESDDLAWWSAQDFVTRRHQLDESVLRMAANSPQK